MWTARLKQTLQQAVMPYAVVSISSALVLLVAGSPACGVVTDLATCCAAAAAAALLLLGLKALAHALTQRQLVRNMQQVLTARVPIIKFEMIERYASLLSYMHPVVCLCMSVKAGVLCICSCR